MAHDVFISYCDEDKRTANAVCSALEARSIRCWIAPRDVPAGKKWVLAITDAIKSSKIMVLVFSSYTNKSDNVEKEVMNAVENGVTIIPFRIEDVSAQGAFKYHLSEIHWLDALTPPLETHLQKLSDEVEACLEAKKDPNGHQNEKEDGPLPPLPPLPPPPIGRWIRWIALAIFLAIFIGAALWFYINRYIPNQEYVARKNSFLGAMPWLNWIVYDPTEYDPYKNIMPSEASIRKDLETLRKYGFTGLITIASKGNLRHIPRIAHELGFNMVIVGIWDLRNSEEVNAALSEAKYADAYCLGHIGLNKYYRLDELKKQRKIFIRKTQRPVTTSEVMAEYETSPAMIEISDFIFPDVQSHWHQGQTPQIAFERIISIAREAAKLASPRGKLVLLKMISYPSGGAEGLSVETQMEFYRLAVKSSRERSDLPHSVWFSFMLAYDPLWKTEEFGWESTEKYLGLFTIDRKPKPAVTQIDWSNKR